MPLEQPRRSDVDERDRDDDGNHPEAAARREQERIDRIELHFERQRPQRAVRTVRVARDALQRQQVDDERREPDVADLVADGLDLQADRIEHERGDERGEQHRIDAREAARPEVRRVEPVRRIGGELERRVAMDAIAADHEEDRHAGRAPCERERQIADDRARLERMPIRPMEVLHADPHDLPTMEIRDDKRGEAAQCVDQVFLVVGGARPRTRRHARSIHAIRFLAMRKAQKARFDRNPQEIRRENKKIAYRISVIKRIRS
ncbi:hypothetical protein BMMON2_15030 [Burkholderia mallei]